MWPVTYFNAEYFAQRYWPHAATVVAQPVGGGYFPTAYFADSYFAPRYWSKTSGATGPFNPIWAIFCNPDDDFGRNE